MRHASITGRSVIASAVLLVVTGSAGYAAARSSPLRAATQEIVTPALVEVPKCWGSAPATATTFPGPNVETIALSVEATSLVKIDDRGRILAAETNTGCAPRDGDHIYLVHPDGSMHEAFGFDVQSFEWTGDFTKFAFQPQS